MPDSIAARVADPIHRSIKLTSVERDVVDTASFQRLRRIKQLGMAQLTYPNATHTRFAHSLGVLAITRRVLDVAQKQFDIDDETAQELRLAALLHDIGHYPYSHLVERIDHVTLSDERVAQPAPQAKQEIDLQRKPYPNHEELAHHILQFQSDIVQAIGGEEKATRIANLATGRDAGDRQLSKLIHSSFDMDRADFLLRDATATGVPQGMVDLEYLLTNIRVSPSGIIGLDWSALAAAEHFLLARYFMYKTVYYHKTTLGFEEACRQLLRRCRDTGNYELPEDGSAIEELVKTSALHGFTDKIVDDVIRKATEDKHPVIRSLATSIMHRRPPRLLHDVASLVERKSGEANNCTVFLNRCEDRLEALAKKHDVPLGRFLVANLKPIRLEDRGSKLSADEARDLPEEHEDELIKVFLPGQEEPKSLVDIPQSIIRICADYAFRITRLYVVEDDLDKVAAIKKDIQGWC